MYNKDPYDFHEYGLHMFCGCQGSGKTTAIVHKLIQLKKRYPKCLIRTNMNYKHEDAEIKHWKDLVSNSNETYGQIEVLDEIQTWFNSNQSKDFPVEMLTEISQQRKQRKMLIGSAQVFSRIAKPIREQTTFVYLPMTLFGCLTIVRISKPEYWSDEDMRFKRYIKTYFFVHTEEIRNSFDTYLKIKKYSDEGFTIRTDLQNVS
ncbi:ATP-binding protein [Sedimentibacter sp.]|uniref:ATP-binding protein n=1 Tax=Sedimentibacter sp. TaxID=1960295 RepID=UPI002897D8BC|nr:ATP-binding protein [Sedimentibacter sp.]